MSRIDLHPEDLKDLQPEGSLTEREEQILEENLEHCSACAYEQALYDDFVEELEAAPEDDEVVERVLDRVIPAQRLCPPQRRPFALAWIAAAAAVLLVTVGASATVWTVVSGWIETRRSIATSQEPDQRSEPEPRSRRRRPRPVEA